MASQEFNDAIISNVRRTSAQAVFEFLDTTASADTTITSQDQESNVSRLDEINNARDYSTMKYTTLETDYFALNGSSHLTPKTSETIPYLVGYLSNSISGSDGTFTTNPVIHCDFTIDHSSIGLSFEFDNEYPTKIEIIYKDSNGNILKDEVLDNNDTTFVYGGRVLNYRSIDIIFLKTKNPYRRIRMYSLIFGIIKQWKDKDLLEYELERQTNITDEEIPISQLQIKVDNLSKEFNIVNPSGVYEFLQSKQLLKTKLGVYLEDGTIEYVTMGNYYLNDWQTDGNTATLTANDKLSFITQSYSVPSATTKTLKNWAITLLTQVGYTDYDIDDSLDSISVTTQFDSIDIKKLLKDIAIASQTMLYVDTDDKVVFKKLPTTQEGEIDFANMYKEPKISLDPVTNQVLVEVWDYSKTPEQRTIIDIHNYSAGDEIFTKEYKDNPFVTTTTIATNVGNYMLGILSNRLEYSIDWRQNPTFDINCKVEVEDGFNENKNMVIEKQTFKYNGYLHGTTLGKGVND